MGSSPDGDAGGSASTALCAGRSLAPAALSQRSCCGAPFEAKPAWVALPEQELCITRAGATGSRLLSQPRG